MHQTEQSAMFLLLCVWAFVHVAVWGPEHNSKQQSEDISTVSGTFLPLAPNVIQF